MRATHWLIVLGTMACGTVFSSGAACGQDLDAAAIHYGDGVHAYFAGNSSRAERSLSEALTLNSQDPRIYYFRALSLLRQGRTAEARGDMLVGAALEVQRPKRFAVGAALERVQGHDRLLLEEFRRQARSETGLNTTGLGQAISSELPGALRQRVVIPLNEYLHPGAPRPAGAGTSEPFAPRTFAPLPAAPQSAAGTPENPFRDDPQRPAGRPPVVPPAPTQTQPSGPASTDNSDPFESSPTDSARPEATTPTPTTTPVEAPLESEDPFGT
jgi:hypothetical protein